MADSALPLQTILAEYGVKDLASGNLKAIEKEINKSIKSIIQLEKDALKAEKGLNRLGKSGKGVGGVPGTVQGVAGAAGEAAQKPIGITSGVISGGVMAGLAAIPVLGGLLSALGGSVGEASDKFVSGVTLQKNLLKDFSTFDKAFGKTGNEFIKGLDKSFSTLTEQKQVFGGLAGRGVEKTTLEKGGGALELLAKAQGVDLKDVLTARLETGKGLEKSEISLIEAYKPLLDNIYTSDIAFKMISDTINNAKGRLEESAKSNKVVSSGLQATGVEIAQGKQSLALMAVSQENYAKSLDAFRLDIDKQRLNFKITSTAAGATTGFVGALREVQAKQDREADESMAYARRKNKFEKENPGVRYTGKALGGNVNKGQNLIVGEIGPEIFTPNQSGRIIPNNKINKLSPINNNNLENKPEKIIQNEKNKPAPQNSNQVSISMTNHFVIQGGNTQDIQKQVEDALNNVARKIAYNQGMNIPG